MKDILTTILNIFWGLLPLIILITLIMWFLNYFFKVSFSFKTFVFIPLTMCFLFWPLILFISAMLFDAPGSVDKLQVLLIANFVLLYPLVLALGLFIFRVKLWNIESKTILMVTVVAIFVAQLAFNYPKMLFNYYRGVSNNPAQKL